MALGKYVAPSNTDGDRIQARDLIDHALIVNVREVRDGIVTQYKPDGGRGIVVAIHDLTSSTTYRDVLWMNNQIVDALAPTVGQGSIGIRIVEAISKSSGRNYITVEALDEATEARAAEVEATLGDEWWMPQEWDDAQAATPDPWHAADKPAASAPALKPITKAVPAPSPG